MTGTRGRPTAYERRRRHARAIAIVVTLAMVGLLALPLMGSIL